jgi:MFS family permease
VIAVIFQGGLFGRLVGQFGENPLMIIGCLLMAASLFAIPYISPEIGGLLGLLVVTAVLAIGNSMASPAITSLVSKISSETEQGRSLGVMQSGASLARAIGPAVGGVLLNNSLNHVDSSTILRTFWTAAGIMIIAALIAVYFSSITPRKAIA